MGNSLFQLGWKGLTNEAYPTDPASVPDLARFDTIFKEALAKSRESVTPAAGDTGGFIKIESVITNWTDSVRHYQSALRQAPDQKTAIQNRDLAITYLKRIKELLKEEEQDAQQAMPQPGEGPPQEGDEEGEGSKKPGEKGEDGKEPKDGKGGEEDPDKEGDKGKNKDKDSAEKDGEKDSPDPNESPTERAHRILEENADLEKGPLSPGRREFQNAEKDW